MSKATASRAPQALEPRPPRQPVQIAASLPPAWTRDWWSGLLLFAALYSAALLVYSGRFKSIDEAILFDMTRTLATSGTFGIEGEQWALITRAIMDGYSYYEPAQPLLAVPWYQLAAWWHAGGLVEAVLLLNPVFFALTGVVLWRIGLRLGYSWSVALAGAVLICIATPFWAYSKTFFREPLAALSLLVTTFCLVRQGRSGFRWSLLAGLAFGGSLLVRTSNLLLLPAFGLLLLGQVWPRRDRGVWPRAGAFGLGAALGFGCLLWYTWLRYGDPLYNFYQGQYFGSSLIVGLWGLTLSPGKGIVLYAPLLLIAIAAFPAFARREPWLAGLIGLSAIVCLLFFARYSLWWGGLNWGPRYLIAILPLLALPLWEGLHWAARSRRRLARRAVATILVLSALVQVTAVTVRYGDYLFWLSQQTQQTEPERGILLTDWLASPLLAQWAWLTPDHSDLLWWQARGTGTVVVWSLLGASVLSILVAGAMLLRSARTRRAPSLPRLAIGSVLIVMLLVSVSALTLSTARADLVEPDFRRASVRIAEGSQSRDEVVTLLDYRTVLFLNEFPERLRVTGLSLAAYPLEGAIQRAMEAIAARARRVWLVADQVDDADPRNGVARWLAEHAFLVDQTSDNGVLVGLYAFEPSNGLAGVDSGAQTFADVLRLRGAKVNAGPIRPGDVALVETAWEVVGRPAGPYRIAAALIDATGRVYASANHEPLSGYARLAGVDPGTFISDRLGLTVPPAAPPGLYYAAIGIYDPDSGRRLDLPGGSSEARIGPFRVLGREAGAAPRRPLQVLFDEGIELIGVDLPTQPTPAGGLLPVTLYWRAKVPIAADYSIFLHLGPAGAPPLAQQDGPPADGRLPTSAWLPGETVADEQLVRIPTGLPGDVYELRGGLYHLPDGRRLLVQSDPAGGDAVSLGQVQIR